MGNTHFHVHAMKEPDYFMSLMSSYGTNQRMGKETHRKWRSGGSTQQITFQYPKVVCNHFLYMHAVDDHNRKRHSPISLEVVWGTKWWPNRVFAFLLAVTEVNVNLAMTYFLGQEVTGQIAFRIKLAHTLIHNRYYNDEEDMSPVIRSKRQQRVPGHATHELLTLAKRKKFDGDELWMQKVAIHSTNAVDAPRYTLTASALLECIDDVSVMACILFGMKIRLAHLQQPIDAHKIKKSSKIKILYTK